MAVVRVAVRQNAFNVSKVHVPIGHASAIQSIRVEMTIAAVAIEFGLMAMAPKLNVSQNFK